MLYETGSSVATLYCSDSDKSNSFGFISPVVKSLSSSKTEYLKQTCWERAVKSHDVKTLNTEGRNHTFWSDINRQYCLDYTLLQTRSYTAGDVMVMCRTAATSMVYFT